MAREFDIKRFRLPAAVNDILTSCPAYTVAHNISELVELAVGNAGDGWQDVTYDVAGQGMVVEARACQWCGGKLRGSLYAAARPGLHVYR